MKQLLKKLNNFRLSATIMAGIAVLGIIVTVLFFAAYQTTTAGSDLMFAQKDTTLLKNAFPDRPILGFVFFISAFLAIILGVAVIAFSLPFIMPKEKGIPSKTIGWVLAAQQVFLLVLVTLGVIALATSVRNTNVLVYVYDEEISDFAAKVLDTSKGYNGVYYTKVGADYIAHEGGFPAGPIDTVLNKPFWVIDIVLGVIVIACGCFMIYPNLRCDFYCPEILTEAEEKARKEAKKAAKEAKKAEKAAA